MRKRDRIKIYTKTIKDLEDKLFDISPEAKKIYGVIKGLEQMVKDIENEPSPK